METIKKDQPPSTELHVVTWGSTNTTGTNAINEPLSGNRAEEARRRLLIAFPDAKKDNAIACALGPDGKEKWVKVDYWFTPIEIPIPPEEKNPGWKVVLAAVISGTGLTAFLIWKLARKQPKSIGAREYRREVDGKVYVVPYEIKSDGLSYLPFKFVGDGKTIRTKDRDNARKAIRGILKNPAYADQIQKFEQTNN